MTPDGGTNTSLAAPLPKMPHTPTPGQVDGDFVQGLLSSLTLGRFVLLSPEPWGQGDVSASQLEAQNGSTMEEYHPNEDVGASLHAPEPTKKDPALDNPRRGPDGSPRQGEGLDDNAPTCFRCRFSFSKAALALCMPEQASRSRWVGERRRTLKETQPS